MESGGELAWFRAEVVRSLVHPRDFARSLAREHFGLAGVLVTLLAGFALSVAIDGLVLESKGLSPLEFLSQVAVDAVFLAVRLAVTVAIVAAVAHYAMRLLRRDALSLDQAFTAFSFALTPLLLAPIAPLLVALTPELFAIAGAIALVTLVRAAIGLALNLRALLPLSMAAAMLVLMLATSALVMQDQLSRVRFSAYAMAPSLVADLSVTPMAGNGTETADFAITLPSGWTNATTGIRGEAARYVSDVADLRVLRVRGVPLATADSYAESISGLEKRGLDSGWSERSIVRINGIIVVDDRYGGNLEGRRVVYRQFTAVPAAQGLALVFHFVDPPDRDGALAQAASIAATWKITR